MLQKIFIFTLAIGALAGFAVAQEGHPLTGSWHGEWAAAGGQPNHVVMFLKWENRTITGTINPGRDGLPIKAASLDADKWLVKLESDTKDGQHIAIEGTLADIGSYNRTITGTWTQGSTKGNFKLTRD
jgi:hypothetical protein